jgi:hypothetical protein
MIVLSQGAFIPNPDGAAARGPESNRASKSVFCSAYGFIPRVRRKKTAPGNSSERDFSE